MPQEEAADKFEKEQAPAREAESGSSNAFREEFSQTITARRNDAQTENGQFTVSKTQDRDAKESGFNISDKKIWNPDIISRPNDIASMTNFRVREGSHDLSTGDRYVVKNGTETLVTPGGDIVRVNSDGTYKVEGDLKGVEKDKNGNQVLVFRDGAKVTVGSSGIVEVERGNHTVRMSRYSTGLILPGHSGKIPFDSPKPIRK